MTPKQRVFSKDTVTRKELLFIKKNVLREDFVSWLNGNYDALRCYHAAKPIDIGGYYKNGFTPSDITKSVTYFKQLLRDINYTGEYDIQETIDLFTGSSDRFIYFILDKEDFLEDSPHYLIYGSELILCFAQHVAPHIKDHLRQIGIPTIFHCDIPLSKFDDDELIEIYVRICKSSGTREQMLHNIFSHYGIIVEGNVSPDSITDHEHPTKTLWDGHAGRYYTNTMDRCERCTD